jgi:hypothetical protein
MALRSGTGEPNGPVREAQALAFILPIPTAHGPA